MNKKELIDSLLILYQNPQLFQSYFNIENVFPQNIKIPFIFINIIFNLYIFL